MTCAECILKRPSKASLSKEEA